MYKLIDCHPMNKENPIKPTNNTSNTNINTTHQACAACKYQRRKCKSDCILAPYFPPNYQNQFLNAHRLFGVSNIIKLIRGLNDNAHKDEAMRSLIYEANARANDPVGGCCRIIGDLQRQLDFYQAELHAVLNQIALYRLKAAGQIDNVGGVIMNQFPLNLNHSYGTAVAYQCEQNNQNVTDLLRLTIDDGSQHEEDVSFMGLLDEEQKESI